MKRFDIYMAGVGGQGIGLLSEAVLRAADMQGTPPAAWTPTASPSGEGWWSPSSG
ncbi:hypothetical protein MASR2M79_11270 [Aminivibrio sp.]